jgi:hypothetical protein
LSPILFIIIDLQIIPLKKDFFIILLIFIKKMLSRFKANTAPDGPASPAHSEPSDEDIAAAEREELSPITLMPVPLIREDTPPPDLQMTPEKYDMIEKYLKVKDETASVYNYQAYFDKSVRNDAKKLREEFSKIQKEYDERLEENTMAHKLVLRQKIQCLKELNEIRALQKKNREARKKREREKEEQRIKEEQWIKEQQEQKLKELLLAQQKQQAAAAAAAQQQQQQSMLMQFLGQSGLDPVTALQQLQQLQQPQQQNSTAALLQLISNVGQQRQQQQNMEAYATIIRAVQQQAQQQQAQQQFAQLQQLQQVTGLDTSLILAHLNSVQQQQQQQQTSSQQQNPQQQNPK